MSSKSESESDYEYDVNVHLRRYCIMKERIKDQRISSITNDFGLNQQLLKTKNQKKKNSFLNSKSSVYFKARLFATRMANLSDSLKYIL